MGSSSKLQEAAREQFHDLGTAKRTETNLTYLVLKYQKYFDQVQGRDCYDSLDKAIRYHYQLAKEELTR